MDSYEPDKLRAIMTLYPCLALEDAACIAEIEKKYPHWEAWPHIGYPDTRLFYARRKLPSPPAMFTRPTFAELRRAMDEWIEINLYSWQHAGQRPAED